MCPADPRAGGGGREGVELPVYTESDTKGSLFSRLFCNVPDPRLAYPP